MVEAAPVALERQPTAGNRSRTDMSRLSAREGKAQGIAAETPWEICSIELQVDPSAHLFDAKNRVHATYRISGIENQAAVASSVGA